MVVGKPIVCMNPEETRAAVAAIKAGSSPATIRDVSQTASGGSSQPTRATLFDQEIEDDVEWDEVLNACFAWGRVYGVRLKRGGAAHITVPRRA